MYTIDKVETSYNKFIRYLKGHIEILSKELDDYSKKNAYYTAISELKNNPTLETFLKSREFLISLNPEISKYFNVIDFFMSRGAKNAPQIDIALKSLMDINEIKSFNESASSSLNVSIIKEELDQYISLLNGANLDVDYLLSVLDKSGLSDNEQIDVLSRICYERIPEKKIEEKLEEEKDKDKEETMDKAIINEQTEPEELVSIESLIERSTLALPVIAELKEKYGNLVKGKNQSQINYASVLSKMHKKNELSFDQVQRCSNELMLTLYLTIIDTNDDIGKLIAKSQDDMLPESDAEFLELCVEELEHAIIQFNNISKVVASKEERVKEEQEKEKIEEPDVKKLIFLVDSRGKCAIDFSKFKRNEVETLLDKCRRGLWRKEYKLGPGCEFSVLMNNVSKTACSYVTLSDGYGLVLDLSHISDAHDRAIERANKNQTIITDYIHAKDDYLQDIYSSQEGIRKEIESKYNISTKGEEVTL